MRIVHNIIIGCCVSVRWRRRIHFRIPFSSRFSQQTDNGRITHISSCLCVSVCIYGVCVNVNFRFELTASDIANFTVILILFFKCYFVADGNITAFIHIRFKSTHTCFDLCSPRVDTKCIVSKCTFSFLFTRYSHTYRHPKNTHVSPSIPNTVFAAFVAPARGQYVHSNKCNDLNFDWTKSSSAAASVHWLWVVNARCAAYTVNITHYTYV